jgi:5-oxoprolinase (ATP-hydrolysing) subunit A
MPRCLATWTATADEDRTVASLDLNGDLGEGFGIWTLGDDDALLRVITSANVACGFHAGDPSIMRRVCATAAAGSVSVGAQVSYADLAGFGRRFIQVDPHELADAIVYQVGALDALARAEGTRVRYVKPHGALYHASAGHEPHARAVIDALRVFGDSLAVVGSPSSLLLQLAEAAGIRPVAEAFADRGYLGDGTLVPRGQPGDLVHEPVHVTERVLRLATEGRVEAVDGTTVEVWAETICVHSDTPGAVHLAEQIRDTLVSHGVALRPFAGPEDG